MLLAHELIKATYTKFIPILYHYKYDFKGISEILLNKEDGYIGIEFRPDGVTYYIKKYFIPKKNCNYFIFTEEIAKERKKRINKILNG